MKNAPRVKLYLCLELEFQTVVSDWFQTGYQTGIRLVSDWYQIGIRLVADEKVAGRPLWVGWVVSVGQ